ncbi:uncharacterized protein K489DRAFT_377382 [Dissoconium aciculare CBS 342.82]|uniref:Uncharacterized protein n=1 Tax=Dissoconium aciculare CBS 342.82 TaxID=1314786 RepID=A0A6J3M9Z3_9PEZI|nr:uncharacterized protein K489DRAFT_377382 [Dissoconium aciculare CBS 342.82]KAF1824856.1 hypothetical protein K489DRAFT_377382 [Dissoconium aciculare CBS 342.82]
MYRQAFVRNARLFSTSVRVQKSVTESAADAIKTADKTVSQKVVLPTIEAAENAASKLKESAGFAAKDAQIKGEQAQNEAAKLGAQARDKAQEVAGEAKKQVDQATKA